MVLVSLSFNCYRRRFLQFTWGPTGEKLKKKIESLSRVLSFPLSAQSLSSRRFGKKETFQWTDPERNEGTSTVWLWLWILKENIHVSSCAIPQEPERTGRSPRGRTFWRSRVKKVAIGIRGDPCTGPQFQVSISTSGFKSAALWRLERKRCAALHLNFCQ